MRNFAFSYTIRNILERVTEMETEKDDVTETLLFVAAENATLKAKIKQQLDSQAGKFPFTVS